MATRSGIDEERDGAGAGRSPAVSARRRRAASLPLSDSPAGRPPRRQWGRFAIGLSVALLGGWLFAALYLSAGGRKPVVVVARDVGRYQDIQAADLTTERVAAGERVNSIPGDELDDVVGHLAATDLTEGMVLTERHLVASQEDLIRPGEARIGALLGDNEAPNGLAGGDLVQLVIVAGSSSTDDELYEDSYDGRVLEVRRPRERNSDRAERIVVFAVDQRQSDVLAAAAKQDRLAVAAVLGQ